LIVLDPASAFLSRVYIRLVGFIFVAFGRGDAGDVL
jgi:hypothetical protein